MYAITGGWGREGLARVRAAAEAGVDLIQIREKQLSGRELYAYCRAARAATAATGVRLLVNDRWDVARAAGLAGVHLPARGLPPALVRRHSPPGFLIGQSCHSAQEAIAAEGADFCVLGPIFATPSKLAYGPPLGLEPLAANFPRPVLALGGIDLSNAASCLAAGAAGIAAIRLFAEAPARAVAALRS